MSDDPWWPHRDPGMVEARRRFLEEELAACEQAWACGVVDAVSDAVALCIDLGCSPPAWLAHAVPAAIAKGPRTARRQALIHYTRWDAVRELRDRKGERDIPKSWRASYDLASEILEGTDAEEKSDTIRASYKLVECDMRSGRARRYYLSHKKLG